MMALSLLKNLSISLHKMLNMGLKCSAWLPSLLHFFPHSVLLMIHSCSSVHRSSWQKHILSICYLPSKHILSPALPLPSSVFISHHLFSSPSTIPSSSCLDDCLCLMLSMWELDSLSLKAYDAVCSFSFCVTGAQVPHCISNLSCLLYG